jgi:hypothetical protein
MNITPARQVIPVSGQISGKRSPVARREATGVIAAGYLLLKT